MTVTSILDLRLDPARLSEARELLDTVLVDTRAFDGCLAVEVLADEHDPAHVIALETWESLEHDNRYREWRAGPGASALRTVLVAPPVLTRWVR